MSRKKKTPPPLVTWIEDPFQIKTNEIFEIQNQSDEIPLDSDLISEENGEPTETSELQSESDEPASPPPTEDLLKIDLTELGAMSDNSSETEDTAEEKTPEVDLADELTGELEGAPSDASAEEPSETTLETAPELILDRDELQSCIEALLFISDKPISLQRLHDLLGPGFEFSLFQEALLALIERYQSIHHGIELVEVAGGYQFRTKPGRAALAQKLVRVQTQKLSSGAMESLAIVAYQQPIMKEEIDKIRGVDSSYFIRNLLEKKLIKISGRSELPGRPMLYSTTEFFLELFGLKELASLPSLRELEQMIAGSETKNPEEYEDPRVREMRRLVGDMKMDRSSDLHYNPKEDEKILKEIRERVAAISSTTPYLDELKAAEATALAPSLPEGESLGDPSGVSAAEPPTEKLDH